MVIGRDCCISKKEAILNSAATIGFDIMYFEWFPVIKEAKNERKNAGCTDCGHINR